MSDGRNEPCRCGSGKKYKKCCLPLDQTVRAERAKAEREAEEAPPLKDAVEAFTWAEGYLLAEGLSPWGAAVAAAVEAVDFYWDEKLAVEPEGIFRPLVDLESFVEDLCLELGVDDDLLHSLVTGHLATTLALGPRGLCAAELLAEEYGDRLPERALRALKAIASATDEICIMGTDEAVSWDGPPPQDDTAVRRVARFGGEAAAFLDAPFSGPGIPLAGARETSLGIAADIAKETGLVFRPGRELSLTGLLIASSVMSGDDEGGEDDEGHVHGENCDHD